MFNENRSFLKNNLVALWVIWAPGFKREEECSEFNEKLFKEISHIFSLAVIKPLSLYTTTFDSSSFFTISMFNKWVNGLTLDWFLFFPNKDVLTSHDSISLILVSTSTCFYWSKINLNVLDASSPAMEERVIYEAEKQLISYDWKHPCKDIIKTEKGLKENRKVLRGKWMTCPLKKQRW